MIKCLPMLVSFLISSIILLLLDKKYSLIIKIDSKIESKFKINKSWRPFFYCCLMFVLILIPPILDIFKDTFNFILTGIIMGVFINFLGFAERNK